MKKNILLILLLKCSLVFTQNNDTLYLKALEIYAIQIDSFYLLNSTTNNLKIYLEENTFLNKIPDKIGKYDIVIISNNNLKKIYKENNGHLAHTIIKPIKIQKDLLQIDIIPYEGKLVKKNLNLALNSWTRVTFKFDCEKNNWLLLKVENQGI